MRKATPLCLLFLLLWPVAQAGPSGNPSGSSPDVKKVEDGSRAETGAVEELPVTFHERRPFLEPLTLVEPEEQVDPDWGPYRLQLEFFTVGKVDGGAYDGADVVLLRLEHLDPGPCKGEGCGVPQFRHLRYLKSDRRMILLGAISDRRAEGPGGRFLGQDPFARFDLVEERDDGLTIPGFESLKEIVGAVPRQVLRLVDEQEGRPDPAKLVKMFAHPRLGEVFTTRPELSPTNRVYAHAPSGRSDTGRPSYEPGGTTPHGCYGSGCYTTNAFFIFRPDGTFLRYAYRPDLDVTGIDWLSEEDPAARPDEATGDPTIHSTGMGHTATSGQYTFLSRIGCSGILVDDIAVVDPDSLGLVDLQQVAAAPGGDPVFGLHAEHRLHTELFEFYLATTHYDWRGDLIEERMSFPDFVKSRPILLWRDPFGRLVRFTRTEFLQPMFCEPIVYLYPVATRRIVVSLAGGVVPSASTPEHGAAWAVLARPNGELRDARDGKPYPYLFWEALSPFVDSPEKGSVVPVAEVQSFLRGALARLGLNENERGDFLEAWLPHLHDAPYYFISFFDRRLIDALAPLEVIPAPDTVIRVLMDYRPLDSPIDVTPQKLGPPPRREGFTLVEWGGLRR